MLDGFLDFGFHFPVVDADAAIGVELEVGVVIEALSEEAVNLFDGAFVEIHFLHYFVEDGNV